MPVALKHSLATIACCASVAACSTPEPVHEASREAGKAAGAVVGSSKGAVAGAAVGSAIAGPAGTAVGAQAGAAAGGVLGARTGDAAAVRATTTPEQREAAKRDAARSEGQSGAGAEPPPASEPR